MSGPRIIAGFGRSGTTWVQDVVAESNSLRTVFEPLHPGAVPEAREFAYLFRKQHDQDDGLSEFLMPYLSGSFHSVWPDYRVWSGWLQPWRAKMRSVDDVKKVSHRFVRSVENIKRYYAQRRRPERITKVIRANLMLSWLKEHFDARIVFIIRHPGAVVLSQFKAIDVWDPYWRLERYRRQENLVAGLDERLKTLLSEKLNPVQSLALAWCVENSIALDHCRESDILVVHYEHLLERGPQEWKRILSALELPSMPDESLVSQPSQQAWGDHAHNPDAIRRYSSWMDRIDSETCRDIAIVLEKSSSTVYGIDQALPIEQSR